LGWSPPRSPLLPRGGGGFPRPLFTVGPLRLGGGGGIPQILPPSGRGLLFRPSCVIVGVGNTRGSHSCPIYATFLFVLTSLPGPFGGYPQSVFFWRRVGLRLGVAIGVFTGSFPPHGHPCFVSARDAIFLISLVFRSHHFLFSFFFWVYSNPCHKGIPLSWIFQVWVDPCQDPSLPHQRKKERITTFNLAKVSSDSWLTQTMNTGSPAVFAQAITLVW